MSSEAQAIDRELGQPFFAWLAERPGADGRPIGEAAAIRIALPQTPEDVEELRGHAATFVAERFPAPEGPDPADIGGRHEYGADRDELAAAQVRETAAAHGGWSEVVRDRAAGAHAPATGDVGAAAIRERAETKADMTISEAGREARAELTREKTREGRAGVAVQADKPLERHATESVPLIGGWLAEKLFGTAENTAPDGTDGLQSVLPPGEAPPARLEPRGEQSR